MSDDEYDVIDEAWQILDEASKKGVDSSMIYSYMNSRGYNVGQMSTRERMKKMLQISQSDEYKKWRINNAYKQRKSSASSNPMFSGHKNRDAYTIAASYDPYIDYSVANKLLENLLNKDSEMEQFTSFSDFITENRIKDHSMGIVYAFVCENYDGLVEAAQNGDKFAMQMLQNASDIETHFIGE